MKKFYTIIAALAVATGMMAQTTKYVKVQAEPTDWSGTYLIVYEDDVNNQAVIFNGALEDLDAVGNFITAPNDKQTINGEDVRVIEATEETNAAVFTVSKAETEGIYYIVSASGCGIGYNKFDKDPETGADIEEPDMSCKKGKTYDNTIAMQEGKTNVIVTAKVGYELRWNNDKNRFRYHESSSKKKTIKFYKKELVDAEGNIVTGVKNVNVNASENAVYNLAGQRVDASHNGIVIKNGKKYMK